MALGQRALRPEALLRAGYSRLLAAVLALALLIGGAVLAGPLPGAAAEDQHYHVVKVSTVDELLAALAPDTVIELEAGTYDLTTASDYG